MQEKTPSPATESSDWYKWAVVFMLWFICFFNYADRQAIFSVFPLLQREMGLSKFELGIIGSAFMWVYAAMAPFAGFTGDRVRRKTLILGGFFFWSVVTLLTGISTRFWHLATFRALEGFGEAFYFPATMSLVSDYHGRETRSRAMSFHQSSVYIGTIGGGALGGYFAQYYGWRLGFYVFGAAGVLLALILLKFIREPVRGQAEMKERPAAVPERPLGVRETLAEIFRTPTAVLLMGVFAGANFVAMVFLTWMPSFLRDKFQMNLAWAGLTATIYIQLASAIGAPTGGVLADALAKRTPGGRMITQATGMLLGAPFIFLTGRTLSIPTLILAMACFGFFKGIYDANIFASLYDVVRPPARATAAGIMNAVGWIGGAIAPIAIGWLASVGGSENEVAYMSTAISFNGAIYLLNALLLLAGITFFARRDIGSRAQVLASGAGPRSGVVPDLKNLTTGSQAPVLGSQGGAGTTTSLPDQTTRLVE